MKRHFELIFPENAEPADLDILAKAGYDAPGQVRLVEARVEESGRVLSGNGGGLIGVVIEGEPLAPFGTAYWVEEVPT